LWSLKQGCLDLACAPVLRPSLLQSIRDHLIVLESFSTDFSEISSRATELGDDWGKWLTELHNMQEKILERCNGANEETAWWIHETISRLEGLRVSLTFLSPWLLPEYAGFRSQTEATLPAVSELKLKELPEIIEGVLRAFPESTDGSLNMSLPARLK